ncbi:hypothetical protein CCACVL1_07762 [Corchorus capsularis]|uniref:Uncharacterized protein n=1 Tax=Corchorus capsularis TaxID=210143 RepID=A0A1R3J423_COCAP|nr:hypothetical protein CCACVL1_07762 [Corchorus capsularis]
MACEPVLSSTSSAALSSSFSSGHTTTSSLGFSLSTSNAATTNFNHPVQVRLDRNNFLLWSEPVTMDDLHNLLLGYEYRLEQHTLAEPITANIATKTNSSSSRPPRNQERGRGSFSWSWQRPWKIKS